MAPPVKIRADAHEGMLDLAVNGQAWLGQLGELRTAVQTDTAFFFKQWGGGRPGGVALLDGREHHEFPPLRREVLGA